MSKVTLARFLGCMLLLSCFFSPAASRAVETECAKVNITIKQDLTLERQAFDAHMRISNGYSHIPIQNIDVDVLFADQAGNPVPATSDPADETALFFIRLDRMENITDINGTGEIAPATIGDIHWLIIPAAGASNETEAGTLYYVGAKLSYTLGGEAKVTDVNPDSIFVKPLPDLAVDYFLPKEIFGDDVFSSQIESAFPFVLGMRVKNNGAGTAGNFKIDMAHPTVQNAQGLLVNFVITQSEVNGEPASDTFRVNLGNIELGEAGMARWQITCPVYGELTAFEAEFSHEDELGGELTSVITSVATHELIRNVMVDLPGRDTIRDFFFQDNEIYQVFESEGLESPVYNQSDGSQLVCEGQNGSEVLYALTTPLTAGLMFVRLPDPFGGEQILKEVLRSDGKRIPPENAWLSRKRNQDQTWEFFVNLFDVNTTASYTLVFDSPAAAPGPPVIRYIPDRSRAEGQQLSFLVEATDPNGTTPSLAAAPLPAGAVFTDLGDGTAAFDWTPAIGQAGKYLVNFTASDGALQSSQRVTITIFSHLDSDGDGMPDEWEMLYFGTLARDGSGDFDNDGISDLEEYLNGTDPSSDNAPSIPVILAPVEGGTVLEGVPQLLIRNSIDPNGDPVAYDFEIYADTYMTQLVDSQAGVGETNQETAWQPGTQLEDNTIYHWRVRATDGRNASLWNYGSFFVNLGNEPPYAPHISFPADGIEIGPNPVLSVTHTADPDNDLVSYGFGLYSDAGLTAPIDAASGIAAGNDGETSWTVGTSLPDNAWYYWKARATDEHGLTAETPVASFFLNAANTAIPAPAIQYPSLEGEINATGPVLTIANSDAGINYWFELDTQPSFDSPAKVTSGPVPAGTGQTGFGVSGLAENSWYVWRVKAGDGVSESHWAKGRFFVNTANEPPQAPAVQNPGDTAWMDSLTPTLMVFPALDPDQDALSYRFEIAQDENFQQTVCYGESPDPAWMVSPELDPNNWYYWRARALDEHGVSGEWTPTTAFFVSSAGAQNVTITVQGDYLGTAPLENLPVYIYSASGTYLGQNRTTDVNGQAVFQPPYGGYKARADIQGISFWSETFNTQSAAIVIPQGMLEVHVHRSGQDVGNAAVSLFSAAGENLNALSHTDGTGSAAFLLPQGNFKFLIEADGNRYWSPLAEVLHNQDIVFEVDLDQ